VLFVPFSVGLGWLVRTAGVGWAGWVFTGVAVLLAGLLVWSTRRPAPVATAEVPDPDGLPADRLPPAPAEVACRELVTLVTDYLDGALPADWRQGIEQHLGQCDGCQEYLNQIRAIIDAVQRMASAERSNLP
jgi:hypothetical protein